MLAHLTPAEIVEVLFDVIAWSKQKVLVSLRIDAVVDPDAFTPLGFDAAGKARDRLAAQARRGQLRERGVDDLPGEGRAGRPRPCLQIGWGTTSEW